MASSDSKNDSKISDVEVIDKICDSLIKMVPSSTRTFSTNDLSKYMKKVVINQEMNDDAQLIYNALQNISVKSNFNGSIVMTSEELLKLTLIFREYCVDVREHTKTKIGEDMAFLASMCFKGVIGENSSDNTMTIVKLTNRLLDLA